MTEDRATRPDPLPRAASAELPTTRLPVPLPSTNTPQQPLAPMPRRVIASVAAGIALVTVGLVVVLWWPGTAGLAGAELVTARFDALRTGLSIGIGGGGIFALYLAWRRQHATEIGLVQKERDQADVARAYDLQRETAEHNRLHAERVAAATERDAADRRVTDLYTKAVEQLGSDKAPVRLGGLYALERLAQDNPHQRLTVVNVLCAYLRMPYTLPGDPPADDAIDTTRTRYEDRVQEREVRLTAQRILATHLKPGPDADPVDTFWPDADLNLTGATLIDFDLIACRPRQAVFTKATFIGMANFDKTTFTERADFRRASFMGHAAFEQTSFTEPARFSEASFASSASFSEASFAALASFSGASFAKFSWFAKASFGRVADFSQASFAGDVSFSGASFAEEAWFRASFTGSAYFSRVSFAGRAFFGKAPLTGLDRIGQALFTGAARFDSTSFAEDARLEGALVAHPLQEPSHWPVGWHPSKEHIAVEGYNGTWHRLVRTDSEGSADQASDG